MFNNYATCSVIMLFRSTSTHLAARRARRCQAARNPEAARKISRLGINRERAIAEAEEAALLARPTIEMRGLPR